MLPADARLRRRQDFSAAVRRGPGTVRVASASVVVHLSVPPAEPEEAIRRDPAPTLAGFVVSRAVGPAVVRNRVKRRLRHLVADRLGHLPTGSHVVVRALPAAASTPYPLLGRELDALLPRAARALAKRGTRAGGRS